VAQGAAELAKLVTKTDNQRQHGVIAEPSGGLSFTPPKSA
jgi:hypothetical protein